WEYGMLEMQFPELADLDRERTAEQWDRILQRVRTEMQGLAKGSKMTHESLGFKDRGPADPAAKSPDLAAARKFVAAAKGLSPERAAALPPAQVVLAYIVGAYHQERDELFRISYLPYPEALPLYNAADQRVHEPPASEGQWLARVLLAAISKVASRQVTF